MIENQKEDGLFEIRFGLIALRKGFITQDHLIKALEIQVLEEIEFGVHRKVGEIFFSQDVMSTDQIEDVLKDISSGISL